MKMSRIAIALIVLLWVLHLFHVQMSPMAVGPTWTTFIHEFDSHRPGPLPEDEETRRKLLFSGLPRRFGTVNGDIRKRMQQESEVTVYFATERAEIPGNSVLFGAARNPNGKIIYGEVKVHVPAARYTRFEPNRPVVDIEMPNELRTAPVQLMAADEFYSRVFPTQPALSGFLFRPNPVIYVHGFNNSFPGELWTAAKLKRDAEIEGPMIVFDWPSHAHLLAYLDDRNEVENSAHPLADFLSATSGRCGGCKLEILAHSLGSRVLLMGLRILSDRQSPAKINNVVFVAPDVDPPFFRDNLNAVRSAGTISRVVLYGSQTDAALLASRRRNGYDPVGLFPVHSWVPDMVAIDATDVSESSLGHGYITSSLEVETDLGCILNSPISHARRKIYDDPSTPGLSHLLMRDFFSKSDN